MDFILNVTSISERAALAVALNLCEDDNFKAAVLSLEKPTFGFFHFENGLPYFVTNSKKLLLERDKPGASNDNAAFFGLSECASTREQDVKPSFVTDARILSMWEMSDEYYKSFNVDENCVGNWFAAIDEQSKKLTQNLPPSLKSSVSSYIHRISLEYLSYCRRLEVLFGLSRYFLMNFITQGDWTQACRLDEIKLAERLLKVSQMTAVQRYCVACVFCLLDDIPRLWEQLSENDKIYVIENSKDTMPESNSLIRLWSNRLIKNRNIKAIQKKQVLWPYVHRELLVYGNVSLLKSFWKKLNEQLRRDTVIDMALLSVEHCNRIQYDSEAFYNRVKLLISNERLRMPNNSFKSLNLPSYYSELIYYFVLEMTEEQRLIFFQETFELKELNVLKCFLDWPLRNYFLKTVNQLWKIIPYDKYKECLLTLISLCSESYNITLEFEFSGNYNFYYEFLNEETTEFYVWRQLYDHYCKSFYKKENKLYDYQSLLWRFWEEAPQTCKQDLFESQKLILTVNGSRNVNSMFIIQLVKKSPFYKTDELLFKLFFKDLPETDRVTLLHSSLGEYICSILLEKENWLLVDWMLRQCLEEDKIPDYKKQFILSDSGLKLCWYTLQENRENLLLDLLDWSFNLDSQKVQFKFELFNSKSCLNEIKLLLCRGEIAEVERLMNFCAASEELKNRFKTRCAKPICIILFNKLKFKQLDKVLAWCFSVEEEKTNFKYEFFTRVAFTTYYRLVILERWADVNWFKEWFKLSNQEIIQLKYNTVCYNLHSNIKHGLFHEEDVLYYFVEPYRWFLDDENMLMDFKKVVEANYFKEFTRKIKIAKGDPFVKKLYFKRGFLNIEQIAKERLSFLVNEIRAGISYNYNGYVTRLVK